MGDGEGSAYDNGAGGSSDAQRARRPVPERTTPRRAWTHLYTQGTAADAASLADVAAPAAEEGSARTVRDGYRVIEENLRKGRQAAAELRSSNELAAPGRVDPQRIASGLAQAFLDPALTRPLLDLARNWIGVIGASARFERAPRLPKAQSAGVPLHPQERAAYGRPAAHGSGPVLTGLSPIRPGEWVGELVIEGKAQRVVIRALEELCQE
jgi:hypothetical protein